MIKQSVVYKNTGLVCSKCNTVIDFVCNDNYAIEGLKCQKCGYEWSILPNAPMNMENTDAHELSEKCIDADREIWDRLGITCGRSSVPREKTVENSWPEYKAAVEKWLSEQSFDKWSDTLIHHVAEDLTNENYHSFVCVLLGADYNNP